MGVGRKQTEERRGCAFGFSCIGAWRGQRYWGFGEKLYWGLLGKALLGFIGQSLIGVYWEKPYWEKALLGKSLVGGESFPSRPSSNLYPQVSCVWNTSSTATLMISRRTFVKRVEDIHRKSCPPWCAFAPLRTWQASGSSCGPSAHCDSPGPTL